MRAKRSLGQNFLIDPNYQRKIVDAIAPEPGVQILEIGPGRGALTQHLVERGCDLTLVELDDALAQQLEARYAHSENVRLIHADILEVELSELGVQVETLKVLGNIPYNITTPILFHLLQRPRPAELVLMVQREVADRMVAVPGNKTYGALAIGVQTVAAVKRLFAVPRTVFKPVPRVDSAVVRITPRSPAELDAGEERALRRLTRVAFGWRRKQFQRILRSHPEFALGREVVVALEAATGFDLTCRPESLSPDDFVKLSRTLEEIDLRIP